MSDDQTPQSELIDEAIRQAERQLEAKLEAFRVSALGEPTPRESSTDDDVAILRPTGGPTKAPREDAIRPAEAPGSSDAPFEVPDEVPFAWQDAPEDPTPFRALQGELTFTADAGTEEFDEIEPTSSDVHPTTTIAEAPSIRPGDVTSLTPIWDSSEGAASGGFGADEDDDAWDRPTTPRNEPARSEPATPQAGRPEPTMSMPSVPSEDEMQFWAHTRTALRNLQQVTESISGQVSREVSALVDRAVTDAVAPTEGGVRAIHSQLQVGMPKLAERIEGAVEQALVGPNNGIRQIRDELPAALDRAARDQRGALREDLDSTAGAIHGAVQADVAHLEQSIATNVTRMASTMTEAASKVERDVDVLGEFVVRFERGMYNELDRVESQLRLAIDRAETSVRDELVAPTETVRKLDDELPARFGRLERTLLEQLQSSQRDVSGVLTSLVDASRASNDRIGLLAATLVNERAQRVEDVETIVDTVTTGWEGLAGAIKVLYEQAADNSRRLSAMEQRLGQLRDLEGAVEQTLAGFSDHVSNLKPAPIVVSVSHPEASVENATRAGWVESPRSSS